MTDKPKKPRGRPRIPGGIVRVMVSLTPEAIARGRELGAGKLSAGIRHAIAQCRPKK